MMWRDRKAIVGSTTLLLLLGVGCGDDTPSGECGDGVAQGAEVCDGSDLDGRTCEDLGYTGGDLACDGLCRLDESGCFEAECGNAVVEGDEDCDGDDLGNASCADLGFTGGDLACDGTCAFDDSGCTNNCGNGVLDAGEEVCDSTDFGPTDCAGEGFDAGALACETDCQSIDTSACCYHGCPAAGDTMCTDDVLGSCETQPDGCLAWVNTDCAATGDVCDDTGDPALCRPPCVSTCANLGDVRCGDATTLQTCEDGGDSCTYWVDTVCPSHCGSTPAICYDGGSGLACNDVYNLDGRPMPHTVPGLLETGHIPNPGSCQTGEHPLYLSYTLQSAADLLMITVHDNAVPFHAWPQISAWTTSSATDFCDPAQRTELACQPETWSPINRLGVDTSSFSAGDVLYFIVSSNHTDFPMANPEILIEELDCAAPTQASLVVPAVTTGVDPRGNIVIGFTGDPPLPDAGTVYIEEASVLIATYDLSASPPELSWHDGRLIIDPTSNLSLGAPVTVTVSLTSTHCGAMISEIFTFETSSTLGPTGESCADPIAANPHGVTVIDYYAAESLDVLGVGLASCQPMVFEGTADAVWSFTLDATATAVTVELPKSFYNRLTSVILDDCQSAASAAGCGSDYYGNHLLVQAGNLTPGATYYLVVGNAYASQYFPDPAFTQFTITQSSPCGNGLVEPWFAEECDDANNAAGDGCDGTCQTEAAYVCTGEPSLCQPVTVLLSEGFGVWPPPGWNIEDGGSTADTWQQCDSCPGVGTTGAPVQLLGATGAYAYVDDDSLVGVDLTEGLVTPPLDCTGLATVHLSFLYYLRKLVANDNLAVEVSVDGGTIYTPVRVYIQSSDNGAVEELDLSAIAANEPDVRIRFLFDDGGDWAWYWLLDDVLVWAY